uniref:hypothetical protein n=1 Tax=Vibrio vulnificus TaxID=672 RepID=UPI001BB0434C
MAFLVCVEFSVYGAMRKLLYCVPAPLNAALCLIILKQWFMVFLCSLGWLVSSLSASWLYWALFFGLLFFSAGNSENCLIQFLGKREVRAV